MMLPRLSVSSVTVSAEGQGSADNNTKPVVEYQLGFQPAGTSGGPVNGDARFLSFLLHDTRQGIVDPR